MTTHALPNELIAEVVHYLGPAELLRFSRTSKGWKQYIAARQNQLFDINGLLLDYVDDPDDFRTMLDCTGAIISGSLALQFIARRFTRTFQAKDMDLYVAEFQAPVVIDWLRFHGYELVYHSRDFLATRIVESNRITFNPTKTANIAVGTYPIRSGHAVFKFYNESKAREIDLIVTVYSPFFAIICFHSTGLMNFITSRLAVSLYPRSSLLERICLVTRSGGGLRMQRVLAKYERRGYSITFCNSSSESFTPANRWLRDHLSSDANVRRTAPWLFDLPFEAQRRSAFWSTRSYPLSAFLLDPPQTGRQFWYRNGWCLDVKQDRNGDERLSLDVRFYWRSGHLDEDVRLPYCVPPAFLAFAAGQEDWRIDNLIPMSDERAIEADISLFSLTSVAP